MQMTFLDLVNRARHECGVRGSDLTSFSVPLAGESQRMIDWINTAYIDIQTAHPDWQWLQNDVSFTTTAGQALYTPTECGVTDLGQWKLHSFRIYPTDVGVRGELFLDQWNYDSWRDLYQFNAFRLQQTRPVSITVAPDSSLGLGPAPNDTGWTVVGQYFREPQEMSEETDVPLVPQKHQMAIIYRAMMLYAAYESAPEVYQNGEVEFTKLMRRMTQDRLPAIALGGTLA